MAITWRDLAAPSFRDTGLLMGQAQQGFNSGFDQLNNVLKREQDTAEANWKVQRDNNTQAFLNSINQYRTADEYQAAQKAGVFDQLRQQFGQQIDHAAIRAAEDGRPSVLQGRDVQDITYGNTMQDAKEAPTKQQVMAGILSGEIKSTDQLAQYSQNRFFLDATGKLRDIEYQNVTRNREGKVFDDNMLTSAVQRREKEAHIGLMGLQGEAVKMQAEAAKERASLERNLRESGGGGEGGTKAPTFSPEVANAYIKNTSYSGGEVGKPEGAKTIDEAIKSAGVEQTDANKIRRVLSEMPGTFKGTVVDPTTKEEKVVDFPIPAQLVGKHLGASYGNGLFTFGRGHYANSLKTLIEDDIKQNANQYAAEYLGVNQVRDNSQYPALIGQGARAAAVRNLLEATDNPAVSAVDIAAGSKTGSKKKSR